MNTINKSRLGSIKSVFNDNETNVHYYDILNKSFHGKVAEIAFAQPILQVGKGEIIWKTAIEGPYFSYASAEQQKRDQLEAKLHLAWQQMAQILQNHPDKKFLDNIMEVPDEDAMFYAEVEGELIIILTEWGFIKDQHTRSQSVLKRMLPGTQKSFILKLVSGKNEPIGGVVCTFGTVGMQQEAESDAEGIIRLNNLERGSTLTVNSKDGVFPEQRFEIDAVEEHTLVIERSFTLTFVVKSSQGLPVAHTAFSFRSTGQPDRSFTTDDTGEGYIHHVEIEGEFTVLSPEEQELIRTPLPDQDETYALVYDPPVTEPAKPNLPTPTASLASSVEIQFIDSQKEPLKGQLVHLEHDGNSRTYTTNQEGIISVEDLEPDTEHTLTLNYRGTDWQKTFFHSQDQLRHTFMVTEEEGPITLEFLNRRNKPIANQAVQVFGLPNNNSFITNGEGLITLDALQAETAYCAMMRYKKADWKEDFTHTGENKYQFIVKHRRFLWWWIPALLLFFFLLSLIPTQVRHHYTVLDNYTKQPLANAFVRNDQANIFQTLQAGTHTDSDGKLTIAYGRYPIYKQIFGGPSTRVTAGKMGYEDLPATVPLGFFKTHRSNLYLGVLNPPTPLPPQPNPIQDCNTGGDAGNHSSLIQYNLKRSQGDFYLEYNLYSIPDIINVYNCISTEIQNHTPIYSFEGSFGTTDLISFNNGPYITVEVISPDGNSSWSYWVNCP